VAVATYAGVEAGCCESLKTMPHKDNKLSTEYRKIKRPFKRPFPPPACAHPVVHSPPPGAPSTLAPPWPGSAGSLAGTAGVGLPGGARLSTSLTSAIGLTTSGSAAAGIRRALRVSGSCRKCSVNKRRNIECKPKIYRRSNSTGLFYPR
jgi:hypothetical protein